MTALRISQQAQNQPLSPRVDSPQYPRTGGYAVATNQIMRIPPDDHRPNSRGPSQPQNVTPIKGALGGARHHPERHRHEGGGRIKSQDSPMPHGLTVQVIIYTLNKYRNHNSFILGA